MIYSLHSLNDAKAETPVLWPPHAKSWLIGKDWCWEGSGAGGKGDNRGWDGWMASPTRWTWVLNSGRWWWTERPGMLRFMGSKRVGHDWVTELNWTICYWTGCIKYFKRMHSLGNWIISPRSMTRQGKNFRWTWQILGRIEKEEGCLENHGEQSLGTDLIFCVPNISLSVWMTHLYSEQTTSKLLGMDDLYIGHTRWAHWWHAER